jgi:hypothetical protein
LTARKATIYIGTRYFTEGERKWVSFEGDPRFEKTKTNIYGRCLPCITNLYEQLQEEKAEIGLGAAYDCWKVVVTVSSLEACIDFLETFVADYPDIQVRGRFGSGDEKKSTKVIVFNADTGEERDRLYHGLKACASRTGQTSDVTYHRACAELYHDLLGDWREWGEFQRIQRPELVKPVIERIRKVLYWER